MLESWNLYYTKKQNELYLFVEVIEIVSLTMDCIVQKGAQIGAFNLNKIFHMHY